MRVGIVGSGTMAGIHIDGWQHTDADLLGLYSIDPKTAHSLAENNNLKIFASYEELLENVDIVDICTPTDLHKDFTLRAAAAGKDIICEKPIALNVSDAKEMIATCQENNVRLFIAQVVRFFPMYRKAQEQVQAGAIGEIGVMRLYRMGYMPQGFENWYADENRSGGIIMDIMIHDIDYALWLAGKAKRVYAKSIKSQHPEISADYALVTIKFENNAMAILDGGWAFPSGNFTTSLDIAGSEGVIEWKMSDANSIIPSLKKNEADIAPVAVPQSVLEQSPYATQIQHFYDAIKNGTEFDVTPQDALNAIELALAAKESLETGQPVYLGGK